MPQDRQQSTTLVGGVVLSLAVIVPLTITAQSTVGQALSATVCAGLTSLKIANATITTADAVEGGAFTPPGGRGGNVRLADLPAFCRVAATLTPSADSDIKIEVWLPRAGWNGKFMGIGNGGLRGNIEYGPMGPALSAGYAVASTDTGHVGAGGSWALGHPEKQIDFGYRAVHEMTVAAKAIVSASYGAAPRYSYWNGCSSGGRQGLKEAQRFPADYDGIIATAPANYWTRMHAHKLTAAQAFQKNAASAVPADKLRMVAAAAVGKCDPRDGAQDGFVEDPRGCDFDPSELQCKGSESASCLTPAQVAALRQAYSPVVHRRSSEQISPGFAVGTELLTGQQISTVSVEHFRYIVFGDPQWDPRSFDLERDHGRAEAADRLGQFNADDPDLTAFRRRGGKLIQAHGWADEQIPPENSIKYYESVVRTMGSGAETDGFYRLFMAPGVRHCEFGFGIGKASTVIDALERWVERGIAPARLVIAPPRAPGRTRLLCPYPQVAVYKGSGSVDDAANFSCGTNPMVK